MSNTSGKFLTRIICPLALFTLIACGPTTETTSAELRQKTDTSDEPKPTSAGDWSATVSLKRVYPSITHSRPVQLFTSPEHADQAFLVLQNGQILLIDSQTGDATTVFLDISTRISRDGNEEGLLSMIFDPNFRKNGYFYVSYSAKDPRRSVISRFSTDGRSPIHADVATELVILEISQPYKNHNGGQVLFGPDGYLYIGLGDGGSRGDPRGNGQNGATLLGSILRIDVSESSLQVPYVIPPDNPFVGISSDFRQEIWAYGLRNPWRFSFDRDTGDLWVGDVGQDRYEEIDLIVPGGNYGWNTMEGEQCYPSPTSCETEDFKLPVHAYPHENGSCSVTGGYVYRGTRIPGLQGTYIYGDFCSGKIWGLRHNGQSEPVNEELVDSTVQIASFAEDRDGEIYILGFDGSIYQLETAKPTRK